MGVMMLIGFSAVVFSYVEPARDAIWTTRLTVPSAAAGARTRAKTAARIARAIGPAFRVVHRLRRARTSPTPTAAIAPTTTAMSGRFSGADGVMSGPLTVAPGEARTGS